MSFFSGLFSGWGSAETATSTKPKATKSATAIIDQNFEHQDTLEQKADQAEHKAKKCIAEYVRLEKAGDSRGAKIQKKRAVMHRKHAATLRQQANNLMQQGIVLEEVSSNAAVHETMQESLRTGQSLVTNIDVDDVAETADEWADLYADSREIGRAMSAPLSLGNGLSDEEEEDVIDAEIAQLLEAQAVEEAEKVTLPSVPQRQPIIEGGGGGGNNNGGSGNGNGNVKVNRKTSALFN